MSVEDNCYLLERRCETNQLIKSTTKGFMTCTKLWPNYPLLLIYGKKIKLVLKKSAVSETLGKLRQLWSVQEKKVTQPMPTGGNV